MPGIQAPHHSDGCGSAVDSLEHDAWIASVMTLVDRRSRHACSVRPAGVTNATPRRGYSMSVSASLLSGSHTRRGSSARSPIAEDPAVVLERPVVAGLTAAEVEQVTPRRCGDPRHRLAHIPLDEPGDGQGTRFLAGGAWAV